MFGRLSLPPPSTRQNKRPLIGAFGVSDLVHVGDVGLGLEEIVSIRIGLGLVEASEQTAAERDSQCNYDSHLGIFSLIYIRRVGRIVIMAQLQIAVTMF